MQTYHVTMLTYITDINGNAAKMKIYFVNCMWYIYLIHQKR